MVTLSFVLAALASNVSSGFPESKNGGLQEAAVEGTLKKLSEFYDDRDKQQIPRIVPLFPQKMPVPIKPDTINAGKETVAPPASGHPNDREKREPSSLLELSLIQVDEGWSGELRELFESSIAAELKMLSARAKYMRSEYERLKQEIEVKALLRNEEYEVSAEANAEMIRLERKLEQTLLKQRTAQADYNRAVFEDRIQQMPKNEKVTGGAFFLQSVTGWSSLIFVHILLCFGIFLAFSEFKRASALQKEGRAEKNHHELRVGLEGLAVKSSFLSILILSLTLCFYFLFLKFVYPIAQL